MRYPVENELVDQKNKILALVNEEEFDKAILLLHFATPLWLKCDYGYKVREIQQRIKDAIRHKRIHAEHWKTEQKWEQMYQSLPF